MISYTLSKPEFQQFQTAFKARAHAGQNSSSDMLLYNIVRGMTVDRGFTAVTNKNKLNNGHQPMAGLSHAKYNLMYGVMTANKKTLFKERYTIELTDAQFEAFLNILKGM